MSLCRAVFRRLPARRPASIGAASLCEIRLSSTLMKKRPFHTAPPLGKKLTNPETSEKEKVRHSEPSPVGRENIGAKRFADFELAGKVFIVTGGAQGLGLALAEALVEAGGKVYCVDRSPEPDEQWRQAQERVVPEWGGSLHYRQQDVSDTEHLDQLMQTIADENGHLDGLVAAAAIQQVTPATEYSAHDVHDMMAVNYTGVMQACTAAARQMMERKTRGTIVIVASMSGLVANKGLLSPVYNSSKAALIQLARNLAMEWSPVNQEGGGGTTRGRRDGILKSEKVRHVVKIGPMHLKGVWIPFERALDFANKEKITEMLYPLFVHNIGALLYHPTNQTRTNQVMAAAERRKQEQSQMRNTPAPAPPGGVLPSIQQHHHHMGLPPQPSLPSHNGSGRPSLDRAHTFPTPPTSASSVMGNMGASDNFQWSQQNMSGAPSTNPMSIDTSLSNARSMPATPATTPPGSSMQSMQSYPQGTQPYDNSRGVYNTATHQSPYPASHSSPQDRNSYGQANSYMRNDMAPPSGRPTAPSEQDVKPPNGMMHQSQAGEQVPQSAGEDETEHEGEYTHDSGAYDANRTAYNYNAPPVAPLSGEHSHLSPEMTGSPGHQAGSGRATPRTAAPPQPFYTQQGYNTPPRIPPPSSNLYNVMSNDRGASNGAPGGDVYGSQNDMSGSLQNGYVPPIMNGAGGPMKRGRDDDDDRASSASLDLKRRKTLMDGPMPAPTFDMNRPPSTLSQRRR